MKLCLFCKYFSITPFSPGWSEYTPGDAYEMTCDMNVWNFDDIESSREFAFREIMAKANECSHYVLDKYAKDLIDQYE